MINSEIKQSSNKNFGLVFFVIFLLISLYPLIYNGEIYKWSIIISFIFLILVLLKSEILTPINNLWFKFGIFLAKIVTPLILMVIFFFVVTPTGLIMRLLRKDLLNLKYNSNNSYWIIKNGQKSKMKNQF